MGSDASTFPQRTLQPQNRMEEQALRAVVKEMNARGANIEVPAMRNPYWHSSNREVESDSQSKEVGAKAVVDNLQAYELIAIDERAAAYKDVKNQIEHHEKSSMSHSERRQTGAHRLYQPIQRPEFYGRSIPRDVRNISGPGALGLPDVRRKVPASDLSDDELIELVSNRATISLGIIPKVVSLAAAFVQAATSETLPNPIAPLDTADPAPSTKPALPREAPRLWADRLADERDMSPAAFIRKVYAPWLGHGLARHHVGELDPELGRRYSGWTRKERHPEDAITEFDEGNPYGRLDDTEALRRRRASGIESKIRARAAKMPQP